MLKEIVSILIIIFLVLVISVLFFGYNPITEIKEKVNQIKYESNLNKTVIDNQTLKIDNPTYFAHDRFRDISYFISYEEDINTDLIVVNFTDDSGYLNNKCYRITQRTMKEDKTICNKCNNKTKGNINCDIQSYEGGALLGSFYVTGGELAPYSMGLDNLLKLISDYIEENNPYGVLDEN